jgi:cell division protein FtsL
MLRIKDSVMAAARKKRSGENGITFSLFLIIIMSMVIVVILAMIKIYLSNQIYYESRRVNYIEREVSALREEKRMLENQVQKLKFKNRVSDTIFSYDEEEAE